MPTLASITSAIRPGVVRVIVTLPNGNFNTGTGFFISERVILTCAHVLMCHGDLKTLKATLLQATPGASVDTLMRNYFDGLNSSIKIELHDGRKLAARVSTLDCKNDAGTLEIDESFAPLTLDTSDVNVFQGSEVMFGGFPVVAYLDNLETPFAINSGFISSMPKTYVGGYEQREFLQINAVNLGGNSGGPLASIDTGKIIGLINGNMNQGNDNVAFIIDAPDGSQQIVKDSFRIPVGIAYGTSLKFLKENSEIRTQLP